MISWANPLLAFISKEIRVWDTVGECHHSSLSGELGFYLVAGKRRHLITVPVYWGADPASLVQKTLAAVRAAEDELLQELLDELVALAPPLG